jgi:hypothetical protein
MAQWRLRPVITAAVVPASSRWRVTRLPVVSCSGRLAATRQRSEVRGLGCRSAEQASLPLCRLKVLHRETMACCPDSGRARAATPLGVRRRATAFLLGEETSSSRIRSASVPGSRWPGSLALAGSKRARVSCGVKYGFGERRRVRGAPRPGSAGGGVKCGRSCVVALPRRGPSSRTVVVSRAWRRTELAAAWAASTLRRVTRAPALQKGARLVSGPGSRR